MITIKPSPTADTRTCDFANVTKDTLYASSVQHIADVGLALTFFRDQIYKSDVNHDTDKLTDIDGFHADFITGFKETGWLTGHSVTLAQVVHHRETFPTPTVQDSANNGGSSQYERNSLPLNAVIGGALNPTWVEWLMGYPLGWTVCEGWGTRSSRRSRNGSPVASKKRKPNAKLAPPEPER